VEDDDDNDEFGGAFGGFGGADNDDVDDEVPGPCPAPASFAPLPAALLAPAPASAFAPAPPAAPLALLSQAEYDAAQRADQPRLPWAWATHGKTRDVYASAITGKWWSQTEEELTAMSQDKRRDWGHIGRIMETELGERLQGDRRCTACQERDEECWVYSEKGAQQVSRPGSTCARCRVVARAGGCSLSTRRPNRRRSPPSPGPRPLAAYKPPGGPPPGAAGGAVAV